MEHRFLSLVMDTNAQAFPFKIQDKGLIWILKGPHVMFCIFFLYILTVVPQDFKMPDKRLRKTMMLFCHVQLITQNDSIEQ